MTSRTNLRETGARGPIVKQDTDANDTVSQDAAANRPPVHRPGNSPPPDETNEKTCQSGAKGPSTKSSLETRQHSGAGPALAEHSKDAKALESGRQAAAYEKK
jgi:hypothetical protein